MFIPLLALIVCELHVGDRLCLFLKVDKFFFYFSVLEKEREIKPTSLAMDMTL